MIKFNEFFQPVGHVDKLGYDINNPNYIPEEYLNFKYFIIFRTCHSYGDWVIISALPKLLKKKYPECTVVIPSPKCIRKFFPNNNWSNKHSNAYNNVIEVFKDNPWVDGMIDEIPNNLPVYHDHFRIYDNNNLNIPLTEQILKYWRFTEEEIIDSQPDIYWSIEEQKEGDRIIKNLFSNKDYGFLYLDDWFYRTDINNLREPLQDKIKLIQNIINKQTIKKWLFYYGKEMDLFPYQLTEESINVDTLKISLRVQNYIKSKSKVVIGHQGGYGTDCMPRYTNTLVVPNAYNYINEHIVRGTTYLSCKDKSLNIKL